MMQNFNYELSKTFKDFIVSENDIISVNNMISLNQVLGYLLSCAKHQSDKKITEIGLALCAISPKPQLDMKEAVALMYS